MMNQKKLEISVFEVISGPLCIASDDGQKIYDRIAAVMEKGGRVMLSFYNVRTLTTAFLNAAIGQLYGKFSEDKILASIEIKDIAKDDNERLKRVVETAKKYFKDPKRFEESEDDNDGT